MGMSNFYRYITDLIFPNRCPCCGSFIKWDELICRKCVSQFPEIKKKPCIKCGKVNCICDKELHYDLCIVPMYYLGLIQKGILNFKLNNGINFGEYFAEKIVEELSEKMLINEIDFVTSVPMSKNKLSKRGYNQANELAKIIARRIKKPVYNNIITKINEELSQHELTEQERINSVQGSFVISNCPQNMKNQTVLLCDDVITTGSTVNECAKLLKMEGARKVYCAIITTTLLNSKNN